ncbi:MAG: hypothetical protein AB8B94_19250 [Hyphomicrobiales bacterium]
MVPITVSSVGLLLALILGLVPLIGQNKGTAPQQAALGATEKLTSTMEELRVSSAAEIAELKTIVSAQAKTISDFQNRLKNLDRGVKNTFFRTKENKDLIATMTGTTLRLSNLEVQMTTLNRAAKNAFFRTKKNKDLLGAMAGTTQRLSNLEVQMTTLNRAAKNAFFRTKKNKDLLGTMAATTQRLSNLEVQMITLNRAVPRISGRVKALQNTTQ